MRSTGFAALFSGRRRHPDDAAGKNISVRPSPGYSNRHCVGGAPRIGEIVQCGDCRSELEVVGISPFSFAPAPEVEEDWGE